MTTPTAPRWYELWFDTRQGRMFIAFESEWYQTNGGDGLPVITATSTPPSASNLALGQLWFDTALVFYISLMVNIEKQITAAIVTTPTATTTPIWVDSLLMLKVLYKLQPHFLSWTFSYQC